MTAPLRPMNLGEILDRTFHIYRSRFLLFEGIAVLPALALMALQAANYAWWNLVPDDFGPRIFLGLTPQDLLYKIAVFQAAFLFQMLTWPAISTLTSASYLGNTSTLRSAILSCLRRWRSWLWMTFASWAIILFAPEFVVSGLLIGTVYLAFDILKLNSAIGDSLGRQSLLVTIAMGWALFLWLSASLSLAIPAWALEGSTTGKSLRRSWPLSRGSGWRIVVAWFMPAILGWIAMFTASTLLQILRSGCPIDFPILFRIKPTQALLLDGLCLPHPVVEELRAIAEAAICTLLAPIYPIAITLFYYDQRIRHEGYDIERMMQAAGLNTPPAPTAEEISAPPLHEPAAAEVRP